MQISSGAVFSLQRRTHEFAIFLEMDQRGPALDLHPQGLQPVDQYSLVSVLRKDEREGERGQTLSDHDPKAAVRPCALNPEVGRRNLDATLDEWLGHLELSVKLQRASRDGQGTRGRSRLGRLVDDTHGNAEPGQPERQHEPGGAGPDDQDRDAGRSVSKQVLHRRSCRDVSPGVREALRSSFSNLVSTMRSG